MVVRTQERHGEKLWGQNERRHEEDRGLGTRRLFEPAQSN